GTELVEPTPDQDRLAPIRFRSVSLAAGYYGDPVAPGMNCHPRGPGAAGAGPAARPGVGGVFWAAPPGLPGRESEPVLRVVMPTD
uniref:hypothetical protein n=1 Tax=Nocardia brasiliensis TaxID=37326 RepID=UPI0024590D49